MVHHVEVSLPEKIKEVFEGAARYRGAYGGRGSGKTRSFAQMCVVRAIDYAFGRGLTGTIMCARESMKSLKDSSLTEIKNAIKNLGLSSFFNFGEHYVRTSNGAIEFTFDGLRQNVDNLKSKSRVLICWIDEAENITESSWQTLLPTIREENSEIWVTWNPKFDGSATDCRFKKVVESYIRSIADLDDQISLKEEDDPQLSSLKEQREVLLEQSNEYKIVSINWQDNPWFPETLNRERLRDREQDALLYRHVWEGGYITVSKGSYYADSLTKARDEGRIGHIPRDELFPCYAFWDIGGTGSKSDATAIWIVQFIDKEIRLIDYYEVQGQSLSYHVEWLRANRYENAVMVLPHDGRTHDRVYDVTIESELNNAGFNVEVVSNQGSGAAMKRIGLSRKWFSRMFFDETKTSAGVKALEWYQEKWDERRNIGLGVNHDWSSHAADAFGMISVYYKEPSAYDSHSYHRRNGSVSWAGI